MQFTKFPSLTNVRPEWLEKHILPYYGNAQAYVSEKIHGTNLTVSFDGTTFLYGRRNGWIEEGESFFNLDYIKAPLEAAITRMFSEMSAVVEEHYKAADHAKAQGCEDVTYPSIPRSFTSIKLRGEFFGGGYEHPDVPKVQGMSQIQGGIQYAQDKSFSVFRIEVDDSILSMHDMGMLCQSFGIPHVPILFIGTLRECLEWSAEYNDTNSIIPRMMPLLDAEGNALTVTAAEGEHYQSLPMFEEGENIKEGNVIAMVDPVTLPNGTALIIKDKNEKWSECKPSKAPKAAPQDLEGDLRVLHDAILPYLTENRFHNVRSKNGEFKQNEMMKAVGLTVKDAIDEYMGDASVESIIWVHLTTAERKQLTKRLNFTATQRIRKAFLETVGM